MPIPVGQIGTGLNYALCVPIQFVTAPFVSWCRARRLRNNPTELKTQLDSLKTQWEGFNFDFKKIEDYGTVFINRWQSFFMNGYHGLCKEVEGGKSLIGILSKEGYGKFFSALSNAELGFGGWSFVAARTLGMPALGLLGYTLFKSAFTEFWNQWNDQPEHYLRNKWWHGARAACGLAMCLGGVGAALLPLTSIGGLAPFFAGGAILGSIGTAICWAYIDKWKGPNFLRFPAMAPPGISNLISKCTNAYPLQFKNF